MASPKRIRHPDMPMVSLKTAKDPATLPTLENYMLGDDHGKCAAPTDWAIIHISATSGRM